ncbi:PREDICTED: synaptogyrin-1 [Chaetura pelagica]|uniref:synaptogyrin-1 n=1 Tax=Chaetura pelagica TaxID=8897 RepID=UPI000523CC4F|nr:PREDICTED: synaptogyrin-1 [Chaetura pelagica]
MALSLMCLLPRQVFSIVVFGSIVNEGYVNRLDEEQEHCIFNRNRNACNYGITVGVLAFLSCLLYLALDAYFPQISSVKDRKKVVLSDIGVSAFWAFLWFVGFCFLTNQWQASKEEDNPMNEGGDAARAAITFSFFSIFTWGSLTFLAFRRLRDITFQEDYNTLFPNSPSLLPYLNLHALGGVSPGVCQNEEDATDAVGTYQQPPPADAFDTETQGYQTQNY